MSARTHVGTWRISAFTSAGMDRNTERFCSPCGFLIPQTLKFAHKDEEPVSHFQEKVLRSGSVSESPTTTLTNPTQSWSRCTSSNATKFNRQINLILPDGNKSRALVTTGLHSGSACVRAHVQPIQHQNLHMCRLHELIK